MTAEQLLRKLAAMYDWTAKEEVVINDFINTISEGLQEELEWWPREEEPA